MTELIEVVTGAASEAETAGALDSPAPTSWAFQDLGDVLDGKAKRTEATMFRRADGVPLIYPGKTHAFVGESESMKSWAPLPHVLNASTLGSCALRRLRGRQGHVRRASPCAWRAPRRHPREAAYIRPSAPLGDEDTRKDLRLVGTAYGTPVLVILDGVTECMMLHGWDPNIGTDVARFLGRYPKWMSSTGAALVFIDHVTKGGDGRGRYAIGSVHKLNGIDGASYTFESKRPFGRGMDGMSAVYVNKDRPGFVRPQADKKKIADMHASSSPEDGAVTITLEAPTSGEDWRPTVLMERISKLVEEALEPMGVRAIRAAVNSQTKHKDQALKFLIEDGYVEPEAGPRGAKLHRSVKPYREISGTDYGALAP